MNNTNLALKISVKLFLILLMLICIHPCYATDTLLAKYPRAILVQLRSEHNRLEAMTKSHDEKGIEEVTRDAIEIRKRMKNDFTDNFHYCPVYYYMDTNADLVKNKQFDGVLMTANGIAVTKPVINSRSDDYFIVYYGYHIYQPKPNKIVAETDKYVYDPESSPGKGLVILNDKFQQIDNYYKLGYDELLFKIRKKNKKYYYQSKHYDMEYFPFAKLFSQNTDLSRYAPHRINRERDVIK